MQLLEAELAEVASVKEHDVVAVLLICNAPALIISSLSSIQPDAATQGRGCTTSRDVDGWGGWRWGGGGDVQMPPGLCPTFQVRTVLYSIPRLSRYS